MGDEYIQHNPDVGDGKQPFIDYFNRMEKEMGLSYPTLRLRLQDIIRALGYSVGASAGAPISEAERSKILDRIAAGELTAEEAMELLEG